MKQHHEIRVVVYGKPIGQPRARFARTKRGGVRTYDPGTASGWREQITLALKRHGIPKSPIETPVEIRARFQFARPARLETRKAILAHGGCGPVRHESKPDIDNLIKACLDACTDLGLWKDDDQVYKVEASKWYAARGERAGLALTILW